MFSVYILYSRSENKYYKGQTSDLEDRLRRHNAGYEKSTKSGVPWELVWFTIKSSRGEALLLERKLKNMNRSKLEAFMEKYEKDSSH